MFSISNPNQSRLKSAWVILKGICSFRRPVIENIDCIPVYIEQKSCIAIVWKIRGHAAMRIFPLGKKRYYMRSGCLVFRAPAEATGIKVKARNLWGSESRHFPLQGLPMAKEMDVLMCTKPLLNKQMLHTIPAPRLHVRFKNAPKVISSRPVFRAGSLSFDKSSIEYPKIASV